jgi:uncharacterized protein
MGSKHRPNADLRTLSRAIVRGDVATVREYLAQGGNPNAADELRSTLLHEAAHARQPVIVQMLLEAGARPNARDRDQMAPLHKAIELPLVARQRDSDGHTVECSSCHNCQDHVDVALAGPDITVVAGNLVQRDSLPLPADARAALAVVRLLLEAGAEVNPHLRTSGANDTALLSFKSPLAYAAEAGNLPAAELLLQHGADVNARDYFGVTPLIDAVDSGSEGIVALLLRAGADANASFKTGLKQTPLMRAVLAASQAELEYRQAAEEGAEAVDPAELAAIRARFERILDLLLAAGARLDAVDARGQTVLFDCINEGCCDLLQKVLAAGADVKRRDTEGKTPLHFCAHTAHYRKLDDGQMAGLVRALIAAGAERDVRDAAGRTPLGLAREYGLAKIAAELKGTRRSS